MNLIMSDIPLNLSINDDDTVYIDLSDKKIGNCIGCFCCWVKTPGKCILRDDATKIYPYIAKSSRLIYVSRIKYGSYDTVMKTMLERAIPIQQAFIRLVDGETHHIQRDVKLKDATIIVYGKTLPEECEIFIKLVARNARNMNFETYNIIFTDEAELQSTVISEVKKWQK